MKKQTMLVFGFALVLLSSAIVFAANPVDFSGTWILDEAKLQATDGPQMEAAKMDIVQKDNSMKRDRFMSNPMMGDFTIAEEMTLDGEMNESETEWGLRKLTATWSDDKKELTIKSSLLMNMDGQEMDIKGTEVMVLESKDVLKIKSLRSSPMGEMESTVYYNRKK